LEELSARFPTMRPARREAGVCAERLVQGAAVATGDVGSLIQAALQSVLPRKTAIEGMARW
jgi:hypothetical protein